MVKHNVVREMKEIKNQLAYSKNLGFFFGAGTSCALNIPNIAQLTTQIEDKLEDTHKEIYSRLKTDIAETFDKDDISIEDILNQIRRIRDITGEKAGNKYLDIDGETAKRLDLSICKIIYEIITEKERVASLIETKKFFSWLQMLNRNFTKEVFTTNYDLIIEKSLEELQTPYFDGFVGAYEPFFCQESIDKFVDQNDITINWIRLWKIHGSLSWFWKEDGDNGYKIVRAGKMCDEIASGTELVIYPSKEKYTASRKEPFVAYFDRLKNYLLKGELLFIFTGYSFSDQHINEIVFKCLRQNNRLSAMVFFFKDSEVEALYQLALTYLNLTVFGPRKAIINGILGEWEYDESDLKPGEAPSVYWNTTDAKFKLGDFISLSNFLIHNSGKRDIIERAANER